MSDPIYTTIKNAVPFNKRNIPALFSGAKSLPRHLNIAVADDALFDRVCGSDSFARAVMNLQTKLGLFEDGKFGRLTLSALLRAADRITLDEDFIVFEGQRYRIDAEGYKVQTFDHAAGLDLHRRGHFSKRKKPISRIIMHWGGLNPKHFHAVAMSPVRKISSHFAIGYNDTDDVVVYQLLDLTHKAWHAGKYNEGSIGIDICQQAAMKWRKYYKKEPYDVEVIDNPSKHGPKRVLSLDPKIAAATRDFVSQLIGIVSGIDEEPIVRADQSIEAYPYSPVVGHHHLARHKWDIAPWWDSLFHET
tara:strand:- start:1973 stop:2884 length:912 start_codon:yes stop_codon:yes gene_type:complete